MTPHDADVLDAEAFRAVAAMLEERCGLAFHAGNRDILDTGLLRVAAAEKLSLSALSHLLAYPSDELLQRVIQAVTIGETYFFRHPEQFEVLSEQVIPQLLRSGRKRLRALSAGCATGEEAYSLAMTLTTYMPGCDVQVIGTDINHAAQKVAERARYGSHSLRVPSLLLDAFLAPVGGGEYEVAQVVRRLVNFRCANLRDANFASQLGFGAGSSEGFDIIFCRNVLVYFAPALVGTVLCRLRDCLAEGGYLFVSALDYTVPIPGLEQVNLDGVPLLRRAAPPRVSPLPILPSLPSRGTPSPSRLTPPPSRLTPPPSRGTPSPSRLTPSWALPRGTVIEPQAIRTALGAARAAADKGLDSADAIAREALSRGRTPEALHLLAFILGERGEKAEMEALLLEAVDSHPDYVLGHLSLGLLERPASERFRSAQYLNTVLELLRTRGDEEILQGPERVQVAMARRLARAGLENLERRP
jgi:chemotaxis protein methyltransferase CheR